MGCCTSLSKSGRPIKASIIQRNTSQAELLEEEKNPDLYRQGSAMQNSQLMPDASPTRMKLLDPSAGPNPASKAPSRQASEFNLNKDLIESMRKERTRSMTVALENGVTIDESMYKLTKEQHQMIYNFVEERTKMMKEDIKRLNAHLCTHDKEVEELALIVEDLRTSEKDIENCVEDLRTFSLIDEEKYYKTLDRDCQFAKDLITEYRTYQNGLCSFQIMKSEVIKILRINNIKPVEKPIEAGPVENTVTEPIFQPPVENTNETQEEIKYEPETPQTFHITTVFEDVEGQAVEPKPANNELEPLKEEQKDETEVKEEEEVSPLVFRGMPGKHLLGGKVVLEKTFDEEEESELKTRSNYLLHHNEGMSPGVQDKDSQEFEGKESTTKKCVDLFDVISNSENIKAETEQKGAAEEKVKRVKKLRAPSGKKEKKSNEVDIRDSKSDLESIGVDFRDTDRGIENLSTKSLRSKKAAEAYSIDFETAQGGVKKITKKVSRVQVKEKIEL